MDITKAELAGNDFIPIPEPGIALAEMESEGILYCPEKMTMFHLNETANVVWRLCDGRRTVPEIIEVLTESFSDVPASRISLDVSDVIEAFVSAGIVRLDKA